MLSITYILPQGKKKEEEANSNNAVKSLHMNLPVVNFKDANVHSHAQSC